MIGLCEKKWCARSKDKEHLSIIPAPYINAASNLPLWVPVMQRRIIRPSLLTAENNNEFSVQQSPWFNSCTFFDSDDSLFSFWSESFFLPPSITSISLLHSRSLQRGNSSLGINPPANTIKALSHHLDRGGVVTKVARLHVCVCGCRCLSICDRGLVQSCGSGEDSIPLSRNKMGNPIPLICLSLWDWAGRVRRDQSHPDILTPTTSSLPSLPSPTSPPRLQM